MHFLSTVRCKAGVEGTAVLGEARFLSKHVPQSKGEARGDSCAGGTSIPSKRVPQSERHRCWGNLDPEQTCASVKATGRCGEDSCSHIGNVYTRSLPHARFSLEIDWLASLFGFLHP